MNNPIDVQETSVAVKQIVTKRLLKKVSCIYIPCKNPEASLKWFAEHFQLSVEGPSVVLDDGTDMMFVEENEGTRMKYRTDAWAGPNFEMNVLSFQVEDIEKLHRDLKQSGVYVEDIRDNGGCGIEFYFADPEGNKFCAWEMQTVVTRERDRFIFGNCYFEGSAGAFLSKVSDQSRGSSKKVRFLDIQSMRNADLEGLQETILMLQQFNADHPESISITGI